MVSWADNEALSYRPDLRDQLLAAYEHGFGLFKNFVSVDHTALDVADSFYFARKNNALTKDDEANYNNRWLQFRGPFTGKTKTLVNKVNGMLGTHNAHVYASWIKNGHQYGRHCDGMDVVIVQVWNQIAYCCESPYNGKPHNAFVLEPGDAIYIRAGTYHTPVIFGERMSLSFSWN